jgi:arabinofuranan 3-O-arabinosyltransferase
MAEAAESVGAGAAREARAARLMGIFDGARLQAYGYTLAIIYAYLCVHFYWIWLVDRAGVPIYTDFVTMWTVGQQALHGHTAPLFDPVAFTKLQQILIKHRPYSLFYHFWPYPPISLIYLMPFAMLPYTYSFITWDILTLLGLLLVVYLIVRRSAAIALVLASPFTLANFAHGQFGFLTGSLLGAALLCLEERPVLAGIFIGVLTYKPQFGLLIPVALLAARQWRAIASAAGTALALAGISVAAFGLGPWQAFPRELLAQGNSILSLYWGGLQTVYGVFRYFEAGAALAFLAQSIVTAGMVIAVWIVWRSPVRYALKAAVLSAAVLIATPYAYYNDLAITAITVAFLAREQIAFGVLRGEQTALLALFATSFAAVPALVVIGFAIAPVGAAVMLALLALVLRRTLRHGGSAALGGEAVDPAEVARAHA